MKPGLYANIHAKRKRIKEGSKEKMRKVGSKELLLLNNLNRRPKQQRRKNSIELFYGRNHNSIY
jgi:hypothetical protein